MGLFKLQFEDDSQVWHDVKNDHGDVMTFDDEADRKSVV